MLQGFTCLWVLKAVRPDNNIILLRVSTPWKFQYNIFKQKWWGCLCEFTHMFWAHLGLTVDSKYVYKYIYAYLSKYPNYPIMNVELFKLIHRPHPYCLLVQLSGMCPCMPSSCEGRTSCMKQHRHSENTLFGGKRGNFIYH